MPIMQSRNITRDRLVEKRNAFRAQYKDVQSSAQEEPVQSEQSVPAASQVSSQPVVQQPVAQPVAQQSVVSATVPTVEKPVTDTNTIAKSAEPYVNAAQPSFGQMPQVHNVAPQHETVPDTERYQLEQELAELRKAREADKKDLEEYRKIKDAKAVDDYVASIGELNTIDTDDAKRLVTPLLKRMDQEKQAMAQQLQEYNQRNVVTRQQRAYEAVIKEFPDIQTLQTTDAYKRAMMSPVTPGSSLTVGQLVVAELQRGNSDYAISAIKAIKQSQQPVPDIAQVASVGATAPTGSAPAPDISGDILSPEQIRQYRYLAQTHQISREDFHNIMAKHKEASKRLR